MDFLSSTVRPQRKEYCKAVVIKASSGLVLTFLLQPTEPPVQFAAANRHRRIEAKQSGRAATKAVNDMPFEGGMK